MVWEDEVRSCVGADLVVQRWYGRSAGAHGDARPDDIYPWMVEALRRHGVEPGRVIFQSAMDLATPFIDESSRRFSETPAWGATFLHPQAMVHAGFKS